MNGPDFPLWLHGLAIGSLIVAIACAAWIAFDVMRHPQKMGVMNLVWPVAALFGSVLWLWLYVAWGRRNGQGIPEPDGEVPFWASVAKGASHCGAGCTLGDIIAEWAAFFFPAIAVWLGYGSLFGREIFAVWVLDFILAFGIGVVLQYYAIKPMRGLSMRQGIWQALKADTLSITSWQVGMYGLMAVIQFAWFEQSFGGTAPVDSVEFWFAMQLAMLAGFATAYPTNWALIRWGVKERM